MQRVDFRAMTANLSKVRILEGLICCATLAISANIMLTEGTGAFIEHLCGLVRKFPFVNSLIQYVLNNEVKGALKLLAGEASDDSSEIPVIKIPEVGLLPNEVLSILSDLHHHESTAESGKAFAYTYTTKLDMGQLTDLLGQAYNQFSESSTANEEHDRMINAVWNTFLHSNALNPMMYQSLRFLEAEVVSMCAWMTHGDGNVAGSLTSGGTESILMAIKTYRDRSKSLNPSVVRPNIVVPVTIHPAFEKACHYFGVEVKHCNTTQDCRVDMSEVRAAIDRNTILLVGSAPQYCHGVIDPIRELAELALQRGLSLHVDACFGGFMLPWLERNGIKISPWDFRVRGVTSISLDVHKYGYSSKGASVVLYKSAELRSYQYFAYCKWPGGLFASPSMAGSRPGGMIAAAWAAMVSMGQSGYRQLAADIWTTTCKISAGVADIHGIKLICQPEMTALAIISDDPAINILAVADVMESLGGWKMERQQLPDSLHMSVLPQHARVVDQLLADLATAVQRVRECPELARQGSTGVYGMVAIIPDKDIVNEFLVKFFGSLFKLSPSYKSIIERHRIKQ